MSMQDITIYRDFPVMDGYVQVPPTNQLVPVDQALDTIAGSQDLVLDDGAETTGRGFGRQRIFRLPGVKPGAEFSPDPVWILTGGAQQ